MVVEPVEAFYFELMEKVSVEFAFVANSSKQGRFSPNRIHFNKGNGTGG